MRFRRRKLTAFMRLNRPVCPPCSFKRVTCRCDFGGGWIMATISNPASCIVVIAALFLSGIGVSLPIDSARAHDNCVTSPGAATPEGEHWYYRTDRVKHRKCWHLLATAPNASAGPPAPPSEPASSVAIPRPTNAASAPQPPADTPNPASEAASTQPAPRWCAYFTGGPTNCDFTSFADCLEVIKGKTALCVQKAQ
jgi:hypothetical protein